MMTNLKPRPNSLTPVFVAVLLFALATAWASPSAAQAPSADSAPPPEPVAAPAALTRATVLKGVSAAPSDDGVVITVEADGTLSDYKAFTITESPPRIVFDLPSLRSPYKAEQRITPTSGPVQQIRHVAHPDKVRLVIETQKANLQKYSAEAVQNGLIIQVGKSEGSAKESAPMLASATAAAPAGAKTNAPAAAVNRIEFADEAAGKSALIIGTTRPVQYDLQKVDEKRVNLHLLNTNVPEQHRRALITTRFESAVDRVTPGQGRNETIVAIDLRESVAYTAEQVGNVIRIEFAPSAIPPKPYESAEAPAWKAESGSTAGDAPKDTAVSPTMAAPQKAPLTVAKANQPSGKGQVVERRADRDYGQDFDLDRQAMKDPYSSREGKVQYYQEQKTRLYTGEKISLDFFETDLKNVFRILKEVSGQNFAIDKEVTGKVTLSLEKPLPWDQVLDLVLKMNGLGKTMEGDVIRISTMATLQKEEKVLAEKRDEFYKAQLRESHVTAFFTLNYADAEEVYNNAIRPFYEIEEKNEESKRKDATEGKDQKIMAKSSFRVNQEFSGTVSVDKRKNMLIVTDTPAAVKRIKELVERLDVVTPQIIIEARIVEANSTFTREIGFDWGTISLEAFKIGGAVKLGPTTMQANNIPSTFSGNNTLGFNFTTIEGLNFSIVDAKLTASELEGKTNIVSSPKISTLNGREAIIKQGVEVPYLERDSSGNATVKFKNVDLLLKVTPTVSGDDRVTMKIFITKNDVIDPTAPEPALSTNEANTNILVEDGDTIVIGGILKDAKKFSEGGIPGLRKLPALGWLFRSEKVENSKNELLIFITPRVVKLEQRKMENKVL
jgi:type IV pilus assembly protein PilQ